MKLGTTSFAFRYLLMDPAQAPPLAGIVRRTRACGLEVLQICENARPLDAPEAEWREAIGEAAAIGLELQLGCKTLDPALFERYLDRAASISSRTVRIVLEEEHGPPPGRRRVEEFLASAARPLERRGMRLAIENHFDIASEVLAEAVAPYPEEMVGFCVDTANSLRNFESPGRVLDLLGPRAFCFHLKDYRIRGSNVGFSVEGAPLGTGSLDLPGVLRKILTFRPAAEIYVENWTPSTGEREADIARDAEWLAASLRGLRGALEAPR